MEHDDLRSHGMDDFYDRVLRFPPEKKNEKWSVSWSDLMMTMFIFFAVMYIYQAGNRELLFGEGPGKNKLSEGGSETIVDIGVSQNPSKVYDQTKQAISEVMVTHPDSVELMKDGAVRIVLAGDLLFDPGRTNLKMGARYQLDQIVRVLNENDLVVNVVGHTDDSPTRSNIYPTNWELSSQRAVMVARYLTEVADVDARRIFVSAHAYHQGILPNSTSGNRALNRRVEIILMKQKPHAAAEN